MEIGKKFNRLSISEYHHYIANHKKYTDFNTLGLYRSILENEKLNTAERIALRDHANTTFGKFYKFLQLKDPVTYFDLSTLGLELTKADENRIWEQIRHEQQRMLRSKRIKHRNFGTYSKHLCYYENCPKHDFMTQFKKDSYVSEMRFDSDFSNWSKAEKAEKRKKQRKNMHLVLQQDIAAIK